MSIQMAFLGGVSTSAITAELATVLALASTSTVSGSIEFRTNGQQVIIKNGSQTILGNWVTPFFDADEWEIRATLDSGSTPATGTLNTWQDFSVTRSWGLSRSTAGISESYLTFDFRRVGATDPEVTISANSITVEKLDIF